IRVRVSVVFFIAQSACCLNSMSITAKYFPASSLAMQRASIEAAAALMSSGNSRNTYRILPLSMYSDLIFGNTVSLKCAQCGQVIEAYSVMVTVALAGPSAMSGSDTGFATSAAVALCASASDIRRSGESPARAASPVSDRAAVKARRVMINGLLQIGAGSRLNKRARHGRGKPGPDGWGSFASFEPQFW